MTDYSAHDIHRLDQAYPDALADIEHHIGDPEQKRRLAEVGGEVYAAELTRDLANSATNPMSLAGWAAIATVRLMDAGKTWEEDTDAAWAKVDELKAELAEVRATANVRQGQLQASREHAEHLRAKLDKPCGSCHPCTNYADETWRAAGRKPPHVIDWDDAQAELKALRAVADAAKAWAEAITAPVEPLPQAEALYRAVQSLPNPADHLGICPGYGCPGCREAGT